MALFDLPLEELRGYTPEIPEPADFDAFWATTLAESRAAGGEVTATRLPVPMPHVEVYDVTFPGFGGHPIKAWYSRPAGVDADLPVVVQYQGYGGGRGLPFSYTFWPAAGFAHFMMDTRGQGGTWGEGSDTPDPVGASQSTPGVMTRGVLAKEDYYYRRLMADAALAVDAARALDGVDGSKVFVNGGSQGGGLALAAAGLVADLTGVMTDVPFLCHYERALAITDEYPYQEIVKYLSVNRNDVDEVRATLPYFDGVLHAMRATAPAVFSVGMMDQVCPPSTVFAAFNHYASPNKDITVYPYNGHEGGGEYQNRVKFFFARRLLGLS